MTTITEQAQHMYETVGSKLPPEVSRAFADDRLALEVRTDRSGLVKAGDTLAPFTLNDATGVDVTLDQLLADGPAVLVFYRGGWCPFCNVALHAYRTELEPALTQRGISLAAISPQLPDGSLSTQEKHELKFPVLSDPENRVAGPLGIAFEPSDEATAAQRQLGLDLTVVNGQERVALPMPTVLLVDDDRTIRFADVRVSYLERTEVSQVLDAVNALPARA